MQKRKIAPKNLELSPEVLTDQTKVLHHHSKSERHIRLYQRSFGQLVEDFVIEMDCKNQAYSFILSSGYFDQFADYCKKNPR